jgi:hypothetical protein
MITVSKLIEQLQQFDPNMEVVVPMAITKDCIDFTSEFDVDETSCLDLSVEGEETWHVQICPPRWVLFDDEN